MKAVKHKRDHNSFLFEQVRDCRNNYVETQNLREYRTFNLLEAHTTIVPSSNRLPGNTQQWTGKYSPPCKAAEFWSKDVFPSMLTQLPPELVIAPAKRRGENHDYSLNALNKNHPSATSVWFCNIITHPQWHSHCARTKCVRMPFLRVIAIVYIARRPTVGHSSERFFWGVEKYLGLVSASKICWVLCRGWKLNWF